jgi:SAM-dependent methyltransferase
VAVTDVVWPLPEPGSALDVARCWDARADRYLDLFRDELDGKPFDRAVLAEFGRRVGAGGRVYDAGCGPCGHVTAMLTAHGLDVQGIDLSPRCVALARREQPGCRFEVLDQRLIEPTGPPLDGLVSYYSVHDQPKRDLAPALRAWAAAICPGGQLLVVAKEGTSDGVIDDPLGSGLRVYWAEFTADELRDAAEAAGFDIDDMTTRAAYDDEIPTRRSYLTATRRGHGVGDAGAIADAASPATRSVDQRSPGR